MVNLREVATWERLDDNDLLLRVRIVPQLNKECLLGITEWSHLWVVFVSEESESLVNAIVCKLVSHSDRFIILSSIGEVLPPSAKIVDLKPYHYLESATYDLNPSQ